MIRFEHEVEKAIQFEVDIEGDVQKYAMSFLHIVNNARENRDCFYKVENSYDNRVFVTCDRGYRDKVENYLSQFGKIISKEDVKRVKIYPVISGKDFDVFYSEDFETQFAVVED